jgi:predicted metal-binding membrane protein
MTPKLMTKFLALLLTLTLALGQGMLAPALAAAPDRQGHEMSDMDMSGMDMSAHKDCCPAPEKNSHAKGGVCADACASMSHAVMHPHAVLPVLYALAGMSYDAVSAPLVSLSLPPDGPPPKV